MMKRDMQRFCICMARHIGERFLCNTIDALFHIRCEILEMILHIQFKAQTRPPRRRFCHVADRQRQTQIFERTGTQGL